MAIALPPPTRRYPDLTRIARAPRQAAAQVVTAAPTSAMARTQTGGSYASILRDNLDPFYALEHEEKLQYARFYAVNLDVAAFAALMVVDSCSRCDITIERRDGRKWVPDDDNDLEDALQEYRCDGEGEGIKFTLAELIGLHAWHYQVPGDMFSIVTDRPGGKSSDWHLYDTNAVSFFDYTVENGRRTPRRARVMLAPGGSVMAGTAFEVPASNVVRLWKPHPIYPSLSTSPMVAGITHCHALWQSMRRTKRQNDSALAMNGILHTPAEAHEDKVPAPDANPDPFDNDEEIERMSQLMSDYLEIGQRSLAADNDLASVLPLMTKWADNLKAPQFIEIAKPLDERQFAYRVESREGFARANNVPASILISGGPGDGNHWTEWLTEDNFKKALGPVMDRICHDDLTTVFFRPLLLDNGYSEAEVRDLRIGYDPSSVTARPDRTESSRELVKLGLLKGARAVEAVGYDPDEDMPDEEEQARVLAFVSAGKAGDVPGQDEAPSTTETQSPPPFALAPGAENPTPPPPTPAPGAQPAALAPAPARAAAAPAPELERRLAKVNRLVARLAEIRSSIGKQLLAKAETAYEHALEHAGTKLRVRARRKEVPVEARQACLEALTNDAPLGPHLAAVGVTELDLLERAFNVYGREARTILSRGQQRLVRAIEDAGFDPATFLSDPANLDEAIGFLSDSLRARAVQQLGAHQPFEEMPGEVSGVVPASIVRNALEVALGNAVVHGGESFDAMPTITSEVGPGMDVIARLTETFGHQIRSEVEGPIGANLRIPIGWEPAAKGTEAARAAFEPEVRFNWVHGYYGDPITPFEPHVELGWSGESYSGPDDPALANPDAFPEGEFYYPSDHDGCTSAFLPFVVNAGEE